MKKKKLVPIKSLQTKADNLLQKKGKEVFKKCEICGKKMNCLHHFFPKSISARLRYEWNNMIPVCISCHFRHHTSFDPTIHAKILEKRGFDWFNNLLKIKKEKIKTNRDYYNNIIELLNKLIYETTN